VSALSRLARALPVRAGVASGIIGFVMVSGSAFAWWTSQAQGTGSAAIGNAVSLTNDATVAASTTSKLYPGGPAADVVTKVNNPNGFAVNVTAATFGSVSVSGASGPCTTTGLTFSTPTAGLPVTIPANGSATITLAGAATMGTTADSGCQNATFTINLSLTASA
jgi:hypothetical protein